jgi:hypothetical protein
VAVKGCVDVNPTCIQTLDLLARALHLMDDEGLHQVAARIAMAIDDLAADGSCAEQPTVN